MSPRVVVPLLIGLMAILSAAMIVLPGTDGMDARIVLLSVPWGALALGFGTLRLVSWQDRREREEQERAPPGA